jgi:hypothetical protein
LKNILGYSAEEWLKRDFLLGRSYSSRWQNGLAYWLIFLLKML